MNLWSSCDSEIYFSYAALFLFPACLSGTLETTNSPGGNNNTTSPGDTTQSGTAQGPVCVSDDLFFSRTVNTILDVECVGCHSATGQASKSGFILSASGGFSDYLERNQTLVDGFAKRKDPEFNNRSLLVLYPLNLVSHGGGTIFKPGSPEVKVLEEYVGRVDTPTECDGKPETPYLEGITFLSPYQQLRRATLLLGARLPTEGEITAVEKDITALDGIYDTLMTEVAFYDLMERGWNDILQTRGVESPTIGLDSITFSGRRWWDTLPKITDAEKAIQGKARSYGERGLRMGPIKLVSYIIKNDKSFKEVLTADYDMVNPYSAKAYFCKRVDNKIAFNILTNSDCSAAVALPFKDPKDPEEYIPVQFPNNGERTGIPAEKPYVHSGLLSSPVFWNRFQSTPTNLNRARTRIFFKKFLDTNILELAPRASDADKVVEYLNPIKNFNQCNVCHIPMDPVAGLLQNFTDTGFRRPFPGGKWDKSYTPGFAGELLPLSRVKDPEKWLGEQAVEDRRFPIAMVGNGLFILTGVEHISAPADVSSPTFLATQRAFEEQQKEIKRIAKLFIESNYNYKTIMKAWLKSPLLTAINMEAKQKDRAEELKVVGMATLQTPEDLNRKMMAIFGRVWQNGARPALVNEGQYGGTDNSAFYFLYDGIDTRELTKRLKIPNGVNGAVMNLFAEEMACQNTALDFSHDTKSRVLFPFVERETLVEAKIRENLVYLFERLWGERLKVNDAAISEMYELWNAIRLDGVMGVDASTYSKKTKNCNTAADRKQIDAVIEDDKLYVIRAWQSVLVYLLSDYKFFYE